MKTQKPSRNSRTHRHLSPLPVSQRRSIAALGTAALLLLGLHSAQAGNTYVDTGSSGSMATGFSNTIPTNGTALTDTLTFNNTGTQSDDLTAQQVLNALILNFGNASALTLNTGTNNNTINLASGGTINVNSAGLTDNLNLAIVGTGGTTINLTGSAGATFGGVISGLAGNTITLNSNPADNTTSHALTLTGTNTFAGNWSVNSSTTYNQNYGPVDLLLNNTTSTVAAPAILGNVTIGSNGNSAGVQASQANQFSANSVISFGNTSNQYFTMNASQTLGGLNSTNGNSVVQLARYTDGTNYGAQTLTLAGSGTYSFGGFFRNSDAGNGGNVLSLVKTGTGTQILTNANSTYTGGTTINGGILSISADGDLGAVPGTVTANSITLNGGTLQITGTTGIGTPTIATNRGITLGASGGTINIATAGTGTFASNEVATQYSGIISGAGNLTVTGGTGTNSGTNPYLLELGGQSTYTGTTTINNATVSFLNAGGQITNNLPTSTVLNLVNNGWDVLNFNNSNQTLAGLSGDSTGKLVSTNGSSPVILTINPAAGQSYTFNGIIGAQTLLGKANSNTTLSLALNGPGTEILTGANTYTGTTTITKGSLQLGSGGTTGTLATGSAITDNANLTINRSNAVTQGTDFSGAALTGTGSFTQQGSGTTILNAANTYSGGTTVNGGILQIGDGTNNSSLGGAAGALTLGGGKLNIKGNATAADSQTVASLTLAAGTNNSIVFTPGTGQTDTLNITNGFNLGANSALNINYSAGTTNGATVGNDIVVFGTAPTFTPGGAYTVTDAGGTGFATLNGSNQVIRLLDNSTSGLPVSGGAAAGNYFVNSAYSTTSTSTPGSLVEALSGNVAANTVTVDTTGLTSGANLALGGNTLTLTGGLAFNGANPYSITSNGGGITTPSGGAITIDNGNTSAGGVTISAPIRANGTNALTFNGTGITTLASNQNSFTGNVNINGGSVIVNAANNTNTPNTSALGNMTVARTITVGSGGTLTFASGDSLGGSTAPALAATIQVNQGGVLTNSGNVFNTLGPIILNGGTINTTGGSSAGFPGFLFRSAITTGGTATSTISGSGTNSQYILTGGVGNEVNFNVASTGQAAGTTDLLVSGVLQDGYTPQNYAPTTASGLIKSGAGLMKVTGANTYTGTTTINGGILSSSTVAGNGTASGIGAGSNVTLNGGTLQFTDGGSVGNGSFNRNITVGTNGGTLDIGTGGYFFSAGAITGSGTLTKLGTRQLIINANSPAFTGNVNINAGEIQIRNTHNTGLGTGTITVANGADLSTGQDGGSTATIGNNIVLNGTSTSGGALEANDGIATTYTGAINLQTTSSFGSNSGTNFTVTGVISGIGGLTKVSANTITLTGANTYTGGTTISGGTLQIGDGTNNGTLGTGAVADNATLSFLSNATGNTISNAISGSGSLTQLGGLTTLSGANTYTGNTNVNVGTLEATNAGALSGYNTANKVVVAGGATLAAAVGGANQFTAANLDTLRADATFSSNTAALGFDTTGGNFTYASNITQALTVNKLGANTLTLTGANTYTGGTLLTSGTLNVGSTGALGTGTISFNGGTLQYGVTPTQDYSTRFSTAANQAYNIDTNSLNASYAGNLTSAGGALTKLGAGTLTLTGANTYTGGTTISGGTLQVGNGTTNGTLGTGAVADSANLAFNSSAGGNTVGNAISGTGVVTQTGGLTTLSGQNTYTGTTTVSGGTLNLTGSLGNTAVTVGSGGTLTGGGTTATTGAIGGTLTASGGSAITLSTPGQTLKSTGAVTLGSVGGYNSTDFTTLNYTLGASPATELLTTPGALTANNAYISLAGLSNGTYTLATYNSITAGYDFSLSNTAGNVTTITGRNTETLTVGANALTLNISGTGNPNVAYFDGAVSNVWNDLTTSATQTNFSTDLAGANDAGNIPASNTDVILNATDATTNRGSSTLTETLGANTIINSLSVNNNGTTTIAADGSNLTINGGASNVGNPTGTGISIGAGANPFTLSVPLVVGGSGANQTYTNASGSLFTVSGTSLIGSASTGNTQTLTLSNTGSGGTTLGTAIGNGLLGGALALVVNNTGTGATILSGANTYTGGTTLTAGALQMSGSGALGSAGSALTVNGGKLDLNGTSQSVGNFGGMGGTILNSAVGAANTLAVANSANGTYAGVLEDNAGTGGTLALTKTGTGTLTLSGADAYSGGTTLNQGTLTSAVAGGFGSGFITINPNIASGTAADNATLNTTGSISSTAAVTVNSEASDGGFGIGTLNFNDATPTIASLTGTGKVVLNNATGTALTVGNAASTTFSGVISEGTVGKGSLTKTGAGTLTLSGANTYSGATTINGGILSTGNLQASGTASGIGSGNSIVLNGGTLQYTGTGVTSTQTIAIGTNGGTLNLTNGLIYSNGLISGTGALTKSGGGQFITGENAANTFSGGTTISGGQLQVRNSTGLGSGPVTVTSGANLALSDYLTPTTTLNLANNINLNGNGGGGGALEGADGGIEIYSGTINLQTSSAIGGGANFTITGPITTTTGSSLTKVGGNTIILTGANTYSGTTTISGGTLSLGNGTANTGSLTGTTGIADNANLTINRTGAVSQATDLNGQAITGTGSLTQAGSGTTTLTTADTYTGTTTVSAGTLTLGTGGSLANTAVSVASGATLNAAANNTIGTTAGTTGLTNSGTLSLANGAAGSTLTLNAASGTTALTLTGPDALTFDLGTSSVDNLLLGGGDKAAVTGTTLITLNDLTGGTLAGGAYTLINAPGGGLGSVSNFSLGTTLLDNYKLALTDTGSLLQLTETPNTTSTTYTLAASAGTVTNLRAGTSTAITNTITNTGTGTADTLNYTNLGDAAPATGTVTATANSGGPVAINGGMSAQTQTFTAGTTSGNVTITPSVGAVTNGTGSTAGTPTLTGTTTATVHVYSGQETYTGPSGNYVNGSNAAVQTQWTGGGAPGIDAAFTGQDTATINGAGNSNVGQTVDLVNASPNLAAVTLGNGSTLTSSGTGTLTLDGTHAGGAATVTLTSGSNTLSAPVTLATNTTANAAAGSALNLSGTLAGTGTLTVNGAGIVTLSATGNSYGNTVVGSGAANSGTLALTAAKADGGGSLTLNTGGTVTLNTSNTAGGNFSALGGGGVILSGGTLANANLSAASGSNDATGETPQGNNYQSGGMLTLTSGTTSYLDFGLGNTGAVFSFSSLAIAGSAPGTLLDILNYKGNFTDGTNGGDGIDQLFIGGTLPAGGLNDIQFLNPSGYNGTVSAAQLMDGEISPAPEPGEWATLSMLGAGLGGLLLKARKRRMNDPIKDSASV